MDRLRNSREEVESSDDFKSLKHLAKLMCEVTTQQQYQLEELTQEVDALSEVDDTLVDSLIQNSKKREKSLDDLLAAAYDLERALLQVSPKPFHVRCAQMTFRVTQSSLQLISVGRSSMQN